MWKILPKLYFNSYGRLFIITAFYAAREAQDQRMLAISSDLHNEFNEDRPERIRKAQVAMLRRRF